MEVVTPVGRPRGSAQDVTIDKRRLTRDVATVAWDIGGTLDSRHLHVQLLFT